jgi:signal transduction histidine kinase/CheY-like chemotaxis protein
MIDDVVAAMQEDQDGFIWVSTSSGISRLDPVSGGWRNYSSADGTIEGAYFDASALRTADGTLYFGGNNGITAFNPRALHDNLVAPRAVITGLQIFGQPWQDVRPGMLPGPIERLSGITLTPQDSVFSLEFSALHFAAPSRNRFAYRLVGFDQDWIGVDAGKRFATYTNLDPGNYTFQVRAANKDGVWSDAAATLEVTVLPPYWKTWWFRTLAVLLVLGLGYGAYRIRVDVLRRQKAMLEQQVSARTERIEQQNRLLERQTDELREQERQVRRRTNELARANDALQENEERLYQAKQRAEDATRQKSEFLANMSHEMRTPLAGVIGMLGFALRDTGLKESTREQILRGQANAQSLLAIINDLLDFSKIEAGKLTIENIDFALDETIGHVVKLFEEQAGVHSVGFAVHLDPDLPRFVVGDPTRLRQILVNLVGNAFKFTESGTVTVRVERRPEDQHDGAGRNMIRFSVRDTGIGIAPENHERIFEEFAQVDSHLQRKVKGTGLGLPLCRRLASLLGGDVWLESVPGEGSTFHARIPLRYPAAAASPQEAAPHAAAAAPSPQGGALVLIVEDDEGTRVLYEKYLKGTVYRPLGVPTLAAAREIIKASRPAAVILDIMLPGEEQQTWRWLSESKAQDPTLPVLVASDSHDERKALSLGADAYFHKPVEREALLAMLQRVIPARSEEVALIIDDDESARYVIRRSLRQPMRFEEASDGERGLALASQLRPGVIFLDLAMPGMTGDEVLDRLMADPATAAIPVIVITSQDVDAGLRKRLGRHARAILQKRDISSELLARTLEGISGDARQ